MLSKVIHREAVGDGEPNERMRTLTVSEPSSCTSSGWSRRWGVLRDRHAEAAVQQFDGHVAHQVVCRGPRDDGVRLGVNDVRHLLDPEALREGGARVF